MKATKILSMGLMMAVAAAFTGCSDDEVIKTPLQQPSVTEGAASYNTLTFSWDKVPNAVQYGYRLTDPLDKVIAEKATVDTSVAFTGLEPATTYTLSVWAFANVNSDYTGAPTVTLKATTADLTKLQTPQVTVTQEGNNYVMTWDAIEGAEEYLYTVNGGSTSLSGSLTEPTYTARGLSTGSYTFTVQAVTTQGGYVDSDVASAEFSITKIVLWSAAGQYYSYAYDSTWDATLEAYDDGTYSILGWYGVEGYDFTFRIDESDENGPFVMECGTFDSETWLYSVPTGIEGYPTVTVYPYYGYSNMSGNASAGKITINNVYVYDGTDYYVDDTFVWSPSVESLCGSYTNNITGQWYNDNYEWEEFDYNDFEATVTKVDDTHISIDGLWWTECPVTATVDFSTMTLSIPAQEYGGYYVFASQNSQTEAVTGTINADGSISINDFSYWYDWGGTTGWYFYLWGVKCNLTR